MASTLKNIVSFVAVGPGVQVTLPHGLHIEGAGLVPDSIRFDNALFTMVACNATNLTIQNNHVVAQDCDALVENWHSVDRNFVTQMQPNLVPQPYVDNGSFGGSGDVQPSVFVFRPGGVASGNVYTSYALLQADLALVAGPKRIQYDDRIAAVTIPAGAWVAGPDITWESPPERGLPTIVNIANGATFTGIPVFNNVYVLNLSAASPFTLANNDRIVICNYADVSSNAGAAPAFSGAALLGAQYVVLDIFNFGSLGGLNWNRVALAMSAAVADTLYAQIGERSMIRQGTISAHALSTCEFILNSPSATLYAQAGVAGTFREINRAAGRFNQYPARGVVAAVAEIPPATIEMGARLRLNANAGSFTQHLPSVATFLTDGCMILVSETGGTNGITIDGDGGDTINNALTYALPPGGAVLLVSNGVANWRAVGVDMKAFGPNPGSAGLASTRQSGIVIGLDTLCYRSWEQLSRLTARELARYMGLYNNVELDPAHVDPISDSDMESSNLLFYSELGGVYLSPGQAYVLSRSAVLR